MPFAEESVSYNDTQKRTGAAYVRFTQDYRVTLRMLNDKAKISWKHWVSEANGGKGMMATCPNITAQTRVCPIDLEIASLDKKDPRYLERRAKKRFMVNVLDRTPVTSCPSCNNETPGKVCTNCQADIRKATFHPLNKVKLLEGGPTLFTKTLNAVEKLQSEELDGAQITDYDIVFQTIGSGRDRQISAIPQAVEPLDDVAMLDAETGEPQKLFDLDILAEPTPLESIALMLQGATVDEINAARGIV